MFHPTFLVNLSFDSVTCPMRSSVKFSTCAIKVSVQKVLHSGALQSLNFQMKVTRPWFLSQQIGQNYFMPLHFTSTVKQTSQDSKKKKKQGTSETMRLI